MSCSLLTILSVTKIHKRIKMCLYWHVHSCTIGLKIIRNGIWKIYEADISNYNCQPSWILKIILKSELPVTTVYPKKYAHGFCFAVLCCGYTLTDFPISTRLTSPALWQSNDCPSASKATLMNLDKYFMWIHYERLHNHNKAKHNKTVCIFLGIYCSLSDFLLSKYMLKG